MDMVSQAEVEKRRKAVRRIKEKKEALGKLSTSLFEPVGKNPYYLSRGEDSRIAIRNLRELSEKLDAVRGGDEAHWLASWLEYLGDTEIATRIRAQPEKFKEIIMARYYELSEFYHPNK